MANFVKSELLSSCLPLWWSSELKLDSQFDLIPWNRLGTSCLCLPYCLLLTVCFSFSNLLPSLKLHFIYLLWHFTELRNDEWDRCRRLFSVISICVSKKRRIQYENVNKILCGILNHQHCIFIHIAVPLLLGLLTTHIFSRFHLFWGYIKRLNFSIFEPVILQQVSLFSSNARVFLFTATKCINMVVCFCARAAILTHSVLCRYPLRLDAPRLAYRLYVSLLGTLMLLVFYRITLLVFVVDFFVFSAIRQRNKIAIRIGHFVC